MRIIVDSGKERITIGSKQMYLWDAFCHNLPDFFDEYSRIRSKIIKYFVVDGINYGELLAHLFFQNEQYFSKAPGLVLILNYLEALDSLDTKDAKGELVLEINDSAYETFKKCAELVGAKKGLKIRVVKENYARKKFEFLYQNPLVFRNLLKARFFVRLVLGWARKLLRKQNRKKTDVLFLANIRFENNLPENNSMFGSTIMELNKRKVSNKTLRYEELERLSNLKRFIKKFFMQKQSYIGDYYSLRHFRNCTRDFRLLRKRWNLVKNNPEFKQIFTYKGYNYYDLLLPKLEIVFNALTYISCDSSNIAKTIINKEDYKVLVLEHEESMYGKGFMLNTRLDKKRKTIALAHELIYRGCGHTYIKDKQVLNRNSELWRPLPDIKCVWSEYSRNELLESCNYPDQIIRVTGNPKFDFLFKRKYDENEIIKKYGLSKNKKRVLCAPSPINLSYIDEINDVSKKVGGLEFIIKPHPGDPRAAQIRERIRQLKNPNIVYADNKDDIYPLIHISDYIFTDTSTVGFEGMLINKIAICCLPENILMPPFLKGHIQVKRVNELASVLKKLEDNATLGKIMKEKKRLKEYYHYKNDGASAERVTLEIEKLL